MSLSDVASIVEIIMKITPAFATFALCTLLLASCADNEPAPGAGQPLPPEQAAAPTTVPWFQGSVDEAFATAKAEQKPLFLYWGAEWCPYCKELEATIFIRDEFIRMSQQFIPLDMSNGDSETIRYADKFAIYGLPTVIVFNPAGEELTRIRGGMNIEQYAAVLDLTLNEVRPVATLVDAAITGEALTPADWELLANYSWGQDRGQALGEEDPAGRLLALHTACPADNRLARSRLALGALEVWLHQDKKDRDGGLAPVHLVSVEGVLADPLLAKANLPALAGYGRDIVELAEGDRQLALQQSLLALYRPAVMDESLHVLQRASVLSGWADVATVLLAEDESLDSGAIDWGRQQADRLVAELGPYQVHAGVNSLWGVYHDLGLTDQARETLALGIAKSKTPFYFMSGMGYVEIDAGNNAAALDWFRQAWEATRNPLDRVRWGSSYVRRLISMDPQNAAEIERATSAVLADITSQANGLDAYQRTLERLGDSLLEWSGDDAARGDVVNALRTQVDNSCAALNADDPGADICEQFLSAEAA